MTQTIYVRPINGIETYTPKEAETDDTKMDSVDQLADVLESVKKQMAAQIAQQAGIDVTAVDLSGIDAVATTRALIASQAENGEAVEVTFDNADKIARAWKATTEASAHNSAANRAMALNLLKLDAEPLTDKENADGKVKSAHDKHVRRVKKTTQLGWPELLKLCRNEDKDLIVSSDTLRAIEDILAENKSKHEQRKAKEEANKKASA